MLGGGEKGDGEKERKSEGGMRKAEKKGGEKVRKVGKKQD